MERHTQQRQDLRPRYIGSRAPIPEKTRPEPSAAYTHRTQHDYTWGTSKPALRPAVPIEISEDQIPAKPKKRRIRRVVHAVTHYERKAAEIEDIRQLATPWWLDPDEIVSRNEAIITDLLESEIESR